MTETFAALLFAHTFADFMLQTNWMARNKRNPLALGLHLVIVYAMAIAAMGSVYPALLALALLHLGIDVGKLVLGAVWKASKGFGPFMIDQALHIASLIAVAAYVPDLWAQGVWAPGAIVTGDDTGILGTGLWSEEAPLPVTLLPSLMALAAGFILATRAGGFAIGLYMARWQNDWPGGLPEGGRAIGLLERALIFLLIMTGQAGGIGFLIAAKSVLRFGAVSDDRKFSEYVIIGTLASFGWAIAAATATILLMGQLPEIALPDL